MRNIFILTLAFSIISCAGLDRNENRLEMIDAKRIVVKMLDLYPDYKGSEIEREVIEVSISSKKNFLEESRRRGMTIFADTGICSSFEHIPTLASPAIFLHGKSSEYLWPELMTPEAWQDILTPDANGVFMYKIYLRYEKLKTFSQEERSNICTEFGGNTYLFGYKSNRVRLNLSHIKF